MYESPAATPEQDEENYRRWCEIIDTWGIVLVFEEEQMPDIEL